jgi:hypothetical protein
MKLCRRCRHYPATVPDRNAMGRPIKVLCVECHQGRLLDDLEEIMLQAQEKESPMPRTRRTPVYAFPHHSYVCYRATPTVVWRVVGRRFVETADGRGAAEYGLAPPRCMEGVVEWAPEENLQACVVEA